MDKRSLTYIEKKLKIISKNKIKFNVNMFFSNFNTLYFNNILALQNRAQILINDQEDRRKKNFRFQEENK